MTEISKAKRALDFRKSVPVASIHNGEPIYYTVCEEFIEGRWEGFVAIVPRKDEENRGTK